MKAIITKTMTDWNVSPSKTTVTELEIEATDKDALYALFFKDYDNRFKYCNNLNYAFRDETQSEEYRVWHSNVNNYANNGGDMW